MSYSLDYRKRVIAYRQEGHSLRNTSGVFKVTVATIREWEKKLREEGTLNPKPLNRTFRKLDPEKLKLYVAEHPDAYLREIAAKFGCAVSTVDKALKRLKITLKKKRQATRSKIRKRWQTSRKRSRISLRIC